MHGLACKVSERTDGVIFSPCLVAFGVAAWHGLEHGLNTRLWYWEWQLATGSKLKLAVSNNLILPARPCRRYMKAPV